MKLQNKTTQNNATGSQAEHGRWYGDACAAAFAMELIGERWTLLIVRELMLGARRFSDIRAELPGLSAKVLTERLDRLEGLGVLVRRHLPSPAASQVYELTEWGTELEPVMQELGRWSVRSPLHDPALPLTPTAFLLSLRTMIDHERADTLECTVLFHIAAGTIMARLSGGELAVERDVEPGRPADAVFSAETVTQLLCVFYGKKPAHECGVTVRGNEALAARFVDLFSLPAKHRHMDEAGDRT